MTWTCMVTSMYGILGWMPRGLHLCSVTQTHRACFFLESWPGRPTLVQRGSHMMTTWTYSCRRSSTTLHSNLTSLSYSGSRQSTSSALKILRPRHGSLTWNEPRNSQSYPTGGDQIWSSDYSCLYIAHQQASQGPDDFSGCLLHCRVFASVAKSAFSWLELVRKLLWAKKNLLKCSLLSDSHVFLLGFL